MVYKVIVIRVCDKEFINYSYAIYNDEGTGILVDPAWETEKILVLLMKYNWILKRY